MRIARSFLPKATGYVGTRPYMKITRGQGNAYSGLRALRLELRDRNSRVVDVITTVSGQANAQAFRTARVSRSGSMEPLPEGLWRVRYPNAGTSGIEWAGRPYDYSASFGPGFGATFTEIVTQDGFPTARSGIAFHLDNNRASSPGTAGCVAFPNLNDMTRFVGWFREPASAPRTIVVDWGLGTLPGRFSLSDVASFGLTSDYLPVWKRLEESLDAGETLPADIAP
jgi:lysozyme